ncbi:TetR/AcrR family transcriptional regulator [Sellimonas caecigallum]|uniref:TetR/AcrR family transcriptional regulator n=1 Tax=Sellimonas caecigallum TaxID=2592333 RepID=A0ABS7L6F9_9FIRM|nr:TetR/AcrR family transcriptional regulator [Sellimonas caecigallum]MBY0758651.1 TetR/AcrR family transcriptional regulator [Sellimonas caecigallum]
MPNQSKYNLILDSLQKLLENRTIQTISVSEIAATAGIGKGSIYYYFPSKDAILEALVKRRYEKPLETAKTLAKQTDISPFTRMAMIFQACRSSSSEFLRQETNEHLSANSNAQEKSFLHQKYLNHLITELKPILSDIISQGITNGQIHFSYPSALAEIVLIVLTVKLDNTLIPSAPEEIEETIVGLISLLEKGTGNPAGSLNFLMSFDDTM